MQDLNELKGMVIEKLEKSGVMGQLKAQMRAKVFSVYLLDHRHTREIKGKCVRFVPEQS
jgi:hypothetical protein